MDYFDALPERIRKVMSGLSVKYEAKILAEYLEAGISENEIVTSLLIDDALLREKKVA